MKQYNKKLAIICFTAFILIITSTCADERNKYNFYKERARVENNTPKFDPDYLKHPPRRHMAVFFEVARESLDIAADTVVEIRPGGMSYRTATAGDFVIVYKDRYGTELGRYAMEDPRYIRVCDIETGEKGGLRPIEKGTIEILLPYDPRIVTIEVGRREDPHMSYKISKQTHGVFKHTDE